MAQKARAAVPNPAGAASGVHRPTWSLIAILVTVIAGLTVADVSLARTETSELHSEAQSEFEDGMRLLHEGKASAAVDALRSAHMLNRRNVNYELGLIEALAADGKMDEAQTLLDDVLQRQPDSGQANLVAARLMLRQHRLAQAESYYHRAIYGEWQDNAPAHRLDARMELVHVLAANGMKQELLAELLPLEEEAANDPTLLKRLADMFLAAGSPQRAADLDRTLIDRNPDDAEAYGSLGEAELELGDYREAQSAFLRAYRLKPDKQLRDRAELASALTALDPTPRRMRSMEKYRRSMRILELTLAASQPCLNASTASAGLLSAAQQALSQKTAAPVTNEASEAILALAEKLWQARVKVCGAGVASGDEQALRLIMEKLRGQA